MQLAVIAITENGLQIARKIKDELESEVEIYISETLSTKISDLKGLRVYPGRLKDFVADIFNDYDGIIFIMALGIVVRVVADFLEDKRFDPAVITIDETGDFVISTLSGHLGGANELSIELADSLDAEPVITTATDRQGKLAMDMLAKRLNSKIEPFNNLKKINAAIVNGDQVNVFSDYELDLDLSDDKITLYSLDDLNKVLAAATVIISNQKIELPAEIDDNYPYLYLRPLNLVVGIGCRRGIDKERIAIAVKEGLKRIDRDLSQVKSLATIDLKSDEKGLIEYAQDKELELNIISRNQVKESDLEFTTSEFVKKAIGVGGVCEPVALLSGKKMELLLRKMKLQGVTVAIAEERSM
jgi:cobalt-precorrin 5A hydrolase